MGRFGYIARNMDRQLSSIIVSDPSIREALALRITIGKTVVSLGCDNEINELSKQINSMYIGFHEVFY